MPTSTWDWSKSTKVNRPEHLGVSVRSSFDSPRFPWTNLKGSGFPTGFSVPARRFPQHDANFNVTALIDASGNVVERYVYDPYGKITILSPDGSTVRTTSNYGWSYLHQGGRQDTATGLLNFRNRDYSTSLMRWTTNDPIGFAGGDTNTYRYVGNGPGNGLDPSGLKQDPNRPMDQGTNTPPAEDGPGPVPMRKPLEPASQPGDPVPVGTKPGLVESLVPVWGSSVESYYYFQNGQYGWGIVYGGLAVSDVFMLKTLGTMAVKGGYYSFSKSGAQKLLVSNQPLKNANVGFSCFNLYKPPIGTENLLVKGLYIKELMSISFSVKLWIHNCLTPFHKWIKKDMILEILNKSQFGKGNFTAKMLDDTLKCLFGGSEKITWHFIRTKFHHELIHVSQMLKNPKLWKDPPYRAVHEVVMLVTAHVEYSGPPLLYIGKVFVGTMADYIKEIYRSKSLDSKAAK